MQLEQPLQPNAPLNQNIAAFQMDGPPVVLDMATALVIQDTNRAESYISSRLWLSEWRVAKAIYEAPVKQDYWRDTTVPRASNPFPLAAQHIRAVLDQVMPALFPEATPFMLEPNEGSSWQIARAWESILSHQIKEAKFKQQIRLIAKDAEVFGVGLGKWGWEYFDRKREIYKRAEKPQKIANPGGGPDIILDTAESDALDVVEITEHVSRPFFKRIEVNHLLVDPCLREPDIRNAKYVVYRDFLTIRDLNKLRDYEGWQIPSEEELKLLAMPPAEQAPSSAMESEATAYPAQGHRALPRYLDSSEDPLDHKLEVLERWCNESVIVVLQRKKTIRNERNPFGIIPFVSCYWDDIPGCFYAFGIPRRIGGIQTHIQGLRNARLDDINLNLQNMWMAKKGTNIASQPIRAYPGAVFKVDSLDDMKPVEKQPILAEAYREEDVLLNDAEKTTGANSLLVQGSLPGGNKSTGMRTAAGANEVGAASGSRIQGFIDVIADQVFIPTCLAFIQMDRERLEPSTMRKIIGKTYWNALSTSHAGDLLPDIFNGEADIEVHMLAGTNLVAKKNMAQSLPLEAQLFMSPGVQQGLAQAGLKTNWIEFARRFEQASGWKSPEDIIIPMTSQDSQRALLQNKAVVNAKATQNRLKQMHDQKMQEQAQAHAGALELVDAKGLAGAGEQIIVRGLERAQEKAEIPNLAGGFTGE